MHEQGYKMTCEPHSFFFLWLGLYIIQCWLPCSKKMPEQVRNQTVRLHKEWRGYKSFRRLLNISWNTNLSSGGEFYKEPHYQQQKVQWLCSLLLTQPYIEKQMGKCFWLGTRVICRNWCYSDKSESANAIARSRPPWMASKKTISQETAQNFKIRLWKNRKRGLINLCNTVFGSDETTINKFGSCGVRTGQPCPPDLYPVEYLWFYFKVEGEATNLSKEQ